MNKVFRLIWSGAKNSWIVAAEKVKGHGGPAPVTVGAALITAVLTVGGGVANALPTGAQIVSGTAGINTVGNVMTITNSHNAIINWQGFSIGASETTKFIQPSALSAVLNRVTGGNPSQILGALQSNGKVLLINPSGIIFGAGSRVDVGGLIASSLDITNQDFLAGRMKFDAGALAGKVENQGTITTPSGGQVYLIAPDVTNKGVITAPNGDVLLAAGKEVLLVDSTNPEIAIVVAAAEGQSINLGSIVADAGRVGMYGSVVRQQGMISANSAVQDATGRIFLKATKEATLEKDSITTATGPQGGSVTVLGEHVGLLDNALVDVSGTNGGGTVLVGGDYQGKNPLVQNAEITYMGKDAIIKADAIDNGNGGKVILWADNTTRAYGSIYARGGANGGDGGFVETSGNYLDVNGIKVSTAAKYGKAGLWLLDPTNIYIALNQASATAAGMVGTDASIDSGGNPFGTTAAVNDSFLGTATLQNALGVGNVTVSTANVTGGGAGNITVVDLISFAANNLTLNAENNIEISSSGGIESSGSSTIVTLNAGNEINLGSNVIIQNNSNSFGTVNLIAGSGGIIGAGLIEAENLKVLSGGNAAVNYAVNSQTVAIGTVAANVTGGNLALNMGGVAATHSVGTVGGTTGIAASGNITLISSGILSQTASITGALLTTSSVGGTTFNNASNAVTGFTATNTTSGNIALNNTTALLTLNSSNISQSGGGDVIINNNGGINTIGLVTTTSVGNVFMTATGPSSNISVLNGAEIRGENVTLTAGQDVLVTGGRVISTDLAGYTTLTAGRDVKIAGGVSNGSVTAANEVKITATTGKLYLDSNGSEAIIEAESPYTVYLNLPGQTAGGYVIDGIEGGATTNIITGTGIYAAPATPAVVGSSLLITYGNTPPPTPDPIPDPQPTTPDPTSQPENINPVINSLDQLPTSPTAPAGLQLIAQAPSDDTPPTEGQVGSGDNNDGNDKDKDKDNQGQSPAAGGTKDEKPKKNYCN